MQYRHFVVTVTLILALVMTSGCTGLLMGDLKAEISDRSAITIPLPLSSVQSALANRNPTTSSANQSSTGEKADTVSVNPLTGKSPFQVKSSTEDPTGIDTADITPATVPSPRVVEHGTLLKAPPGEAVILRSKTASCSPVAGAKVAVTLIGTLNKTPIADCITQENGDFSFYVLPFTAIPADSLYAFNFEITSPGHILPEGSSNEVTDLAYVSDGPRYTFNVCYQQPSEPDAMAVTHGGIAVFGRFSS
jgi:hypothetical protein